MYHAFVDGELIDDTIMLDLQKQTVMKFATAGDRNTTLSAPTIGMLSLVTSDVVRVWDGTTWTPLSYSTHTHAIDPAVVTLTGVQTLTNKTVLWPISTKTANYTITLTDRAIIVNSASGVTITLPSAVTAQAGAAFTVKSIGLGTVTMGATAGNIDGSAPSATTLTQWNARTFVSDGSNWFVM